MIVRHAPAERRALCDLLDDLGPDAPTLCAGWTAHDLAAHLVLREHRPDALPGIVLAPLAGHTAAVQEALKARHGFAGLVRLIRSGPTGVHLLLPTAIYRLVPALEAVVHKDSVLGPLKFRPCDHVAETPILIVEGRQSDKYQVYPSLIGKVANPNAITIPCGQTGCEPLMKS